jgi:integrase
MKKLTDKTVAGTRHSLRDTDVTGLVLKVTEAGKRIFCLHTVFPGTKFQAMRTLGRYPELSLAGAREKAIKWRGLIAQDIDPSDAEEKERRDRAIVRGNTFGIFAEKYIAARTNKRAEMDGKEIRRLLLPAWENTPIANITPRDVRELINKLKVKPHNARHGWQHMVLIFKQAVFEELIPVSPCASLDRRLLFRGVKLNHRERVLNADEIHALWHAAEKEAAGPFYKLLLLTGVRADELGSAVWSEFNLKARRWVIPRERFKSDSEHVVPLTDTAIEILESLPRAAKSEKIWLINPRTVNVKTRIDKSMAEILKAKLPGWQAHDLRRVIRSNMSAMEIPDHVAEMVIGHGRRGLARVYDQHKYEPQVRQALEKWAERLLTIVGLTPTPTAENVVRLVRKATT